MSGEPKEWEKITPQHLQPAVQHIRMEFGTGEWNCSHITKPLGHAALHAPVSDPASLVPYQAAFDGYRRAIGPRATKEFDDLLKQGTPPAVFKAYFDAYYEGLRVNVRDEFNRILSVGLANAEALETHPVDWARSQLQLLINGHVHLVERWIKEVCDTQEMPEPESIEMKEFEEVIFWRKWRAPRLIYMQPAGNMRYDPATAWSREDEAQTTRLLGARSHRFLQFLDIYLEKVAGAAHVTVAQNPEYLKLRKHPAESLSNVQPDAVPEQPSVEAREPQSGALLSNYRSELKRAILLQIGRNPGASDLEV